VRNEERGQAGHSVSWRNGDLTRPPHRF
jgi:hypothetical protein